MRRRKRAGWRHTGCRHPDASDGGSQPVDAGDPRYTVELTGTMAIDGLSAIAFSNRMSLPDGGGAYDPNFAGIILGVGSRDYLCEILANQSSTSFTLQGPIYILDVRADGGVSPGIYPIPAQPTGGAEGEAAFGYKAGFAGYTVDGGITLTSFTPPRQLLGNNYGGGETTFSLSTVFTDDQGNIGTLGGTVRAAGCEGYALPSF